MEIRTRKLFALSSLFLFTFIGKLSADTIYLKNGRSIDGLVKTENDKEIELDVGFGTVRFPKNQIISVHKSTPEEAGILKQEWQKEKQQQAIAENKLRSESPVKDIAMHQDGGHIFVNTILNKQVPALMLLDTGASVVVLPKNVAKRLGIDTTIKEEEDKIQLQLADGRKINARYVRLESIGIEDVEAKNVDTAILLENTEDMDIKDGVLGMSFLNRFNFKVDQKNKRLFLEKIE